MLKYISIVFFLLNILPIRAQEPSTDNTPVRSDDVPSQKEYYWFTPHAAITVPNPTGNTAFRKNFAGVYEVSAGMDVMPFKGIFVGAVYKNATLKITGITGATYFHYSPIMKINNAGIRVGGKTFVGSRNRMTGQASVTFGQNWTMFKDIRCKDSTMAVPVPKYTCTYLEPEIALYFLLENNFAIGITVSYDIYTKNFNPYDICLESWKTIGSTGSGPTQYFSFGFGFSYSFYKRKK
ncbi:MAG TPA: hypothetical protein VLB84_13195 [Bacteroidia bacterium]|jgi:hypothetical protein|nr:hypothetical protein [Bacteroidia bacterium]